jgi:hypothetical protein
MTRRDAPTPCGGATLRAYSLDLDDVEEFLTVRGADRASA